MSRSTASNLTDESRSIGDRYIGEYASHVKPLSMSILSSWSDDVGRVAAPAMEQLGDDWYDAVRCGFSDIIEFACVINEAYSILKSVTEEAERAILRAENAR